MSEDTNPRISEVLPSDVWGMLEHDASAVLIDVRTRAEWSYVGIPDLRELPNPFLMLEWEMWPDMQINPVFIEKVEEQLWGRVPSSMFFLCRSGVRSLKATRTMASHFEGAGKPVKCVNVVNGFEGDKNDVGHRGIVNGWKACGLPWRQS